MDKKSLCWHSRVENMCQWHPSQTPWERKWEAKRENNWKMRYCAGRARCGRGEGSPPHPQPCSAHGCRSYPVIYNHSEQYGCGRDQPTSQECTLLVPLPARPTPVSPSQSPTSSRCFFLMLHWRRREGKKEFNNVQLGRLRKGSGGVLGFRLRIKFIDVWCSAQHRPELQPPAHVQEELTLLAPCGKSPPPPAYSPSLPPSLAPSLPPSCTS